LSDHGFTIFFFSSQQSKVALEIRKSIPVTFATSLNVVYWPQLGYLVALPLRENMRTEQDFQLPGFRFQFCTKTMVYYRCDKTLELDHHLGDLHGLIVGIKCCFSNKLI